MLVPSPINKYTEESHSFFSRFMDKVRHEMGEDELMKHFMALTESVQHKTALAKSKSNGVTTMAKKKIYTGPVDPSPSSQPTGFKWTLDALAQNIKAALHITPTNTAAIKEALTLPIRDQLALLSAITERLLSKNAPVNDRNNTFETVMNILGNLDKEHSDLVYVVTRPLLQQFHDDIPKPYINYVGHKYRTADGSCNSLLFPEVGKAGTNYTRTVTRKGLNNTQLPPAKEVFDKLLRRPDGVFNEHQSGVNMLLLYVAILITHDLFYTDPNDPKRNLTTSYADLSPLYGFNREDQESIRVMEYGLLKADQWVDRRLVIQPPGVAALLVMFSRNHNFIAKKLLEINENERFSYGPGKPLKNKQEQDEHLFQTARLINNGCYVNIIVQDYVRTIIGTAADSEFHFDLINNVADPIYGNAVSIEFNMVYRWHAGIGKEDAQWISEVMDVLMSQKRSMGDEGHSAQERVLINKNSQSSSRFDQLLGMFNEHFVHASPEELERGLPIAGCHRDLETGQFSDTDLVRGLKLGYEQILSEVGNGRNTPASLEHVEIAGINQSRLLDTCYFNDFRRFLNLTPLKTFEDFSEKVEVQKALEELYGTPDKVELYAGLMVERTKQTGLRFPYTMSRAILSDAVNLIRNDRYLIKELTPATLTNWGYQYIAGDPNKQDRVLPNMVGSLFPEAANPFSEKELTDLFYVPA
ncbi:Psi-producing oxygenase A [Choanephora cucurbitarum]|uniref:Psi-producing oxygenase A n=1 Tax=Choanephora cucurbitarum TaxID=101091 RepID=A0A1C7NBU5_9FUNG|nr:Psi-producing oxygenase A [Choanephora cucurbitarum]